MTKMYDSTNIDDIPLDAPIIAYYVDGGFAATEEQLAKFPNALKVKITVTHTNLLADVLDIESGDATPEQGAAWTEQSVGLKTVYHSKSVDVPDVERHWIADWTGESHLVPGSVATQYANPDTSGGHYDLSETDGTWPGVQPVPPAPPQPPQPQPEEDMKPYYVTNSAGTGFVVAADLSHKTGIPDGEDAGVLLATGNYQQLKLTDVALAQIPG